MEAYFEMHFTTTTEKILNPDNLIRVMNDTQIALW